MSNSDDLPLAWLVRVEDVPARGLDWEAAATDVERRAIASDLDLVSLDRLIARGRIEGIAGGSYRFKGMITASVVQACIVTLDPVLAQLDEPLAVEFRQGDFDDGLSATPDFAEADVERIENGTLEVGRVVFESFAAALDPYPRKPGVDADAPVEVSAAPKGSSLHPFAVLSKLKDT